MFYLRQNLLQRFHTPRFTETSPEFHFKNYTGKASNFASAEALSLNDVYLYNRREKKGNGEFVLGPGANIICQTFDIF